MSWMPRWQRRLPLPAQASAWKICPAPSPGRSDGRPLAGGGLTVAMVVTLALAPVIQAIAVEDHRLVHCRSTDSRSG
ncbi:MAG: hypothetical protein MUE47_11165 [Acidobacteria bacterium]|nr:hypothetical protein [Acidobacteriota bacterium]